MRWYTPQQNQGQIVTVSYAYDGDGGAYRRTHDAADRRTVYEHGDLDWPRETEGVDYERAPRVVEWADCEKPESES